MTPVKIVERKTAGHLFPKKHEKKKEQKWPESTFVRTPENDQMFTTTR